MAGVIRRLIALLVCAVALAACQLDVTVDVVVDDDGTGLITVVAVADAELVAAEPTLVDDMVLDDVTAAGWSIDGPNPTDEGGLQLQMSHEFFSSGEATNLLQSLGPPFTQMEVGRETTGDITTTRLSGRLVLINGFDAYADADLVAAVGGQPFAEQIASASASPDNSLSFLVRAALPGVLDDELTNVEPNAGGVLEWQVPVDGSTLQWQAEATQQPGQGKQWARPLSIAALIALIAWVAFMTIFISYVVVARFRRARQYKHRHLGQR